MVSLRYGRGLHGAWGRVVQTGAGQQAVRCGMQVDVGSDWHRSWAGLLLGSRWRMTPIFAGYAATASAQGSGGSRWLAQAGGCARRREPVAL